MALLSYRSTSLPWCELSPAELSMGRKIRSTVPQTNKHLVPKWPYLTDFQEKNKVFKDKQKENYDSRHRVREAPKIQDDTEVWVNTGQDPVRGRVVSTSEAPRSYIVETPSGDIRRNRSQLNVVPPNEEDTETAQEAAPPASNPASPPKPSRIPIRVATRSKTGTPVGPPDYLRY